MVVTREVEVDRWLSLSLEPSRNVQLPDDPDARLESLAICAVLDTPREPLFDNVVYTVAQVFRAPAAALILVAQHRVWPKAAVGLHDADLERAALFCRTVIATGKPLGVEDIMVDPRFSQAMAALGEPGFRFCAAAPVFGPGGHRIGVLCALDRQTRRVTAEQMRTLQQLADQAGELLWIRVPGLDLEAVRQARH